MARSSAAVIFKFNPGDLVADPFCSDATALAGDDSAGLFVVVSVGCGDAVIDLVSLVSILAGGDEILLLLPLVTLLLSFTSFGDDGVEMVWMTMSGLAFDVLFSGGGGGDDGRDDGFALLLTLSGVSMPTVVVVVVVVEPFVCSTIRLSLFTGTDGSTTSN